jgi:glycerol-3-phosphate dehydrogenase
MRQEFAETADDVLWRRSKLGLHLDPDAVAALTQFMETCGGRAAAE